MIQQRRNAPDHVVTLVLSVLAVCTSFHAQDAQAGPPQPEKASKDAIKRSTECNPSGTARSEEGLRHVIRVLNADDRQATLLWEVINDGKKDVFLDSLHSFIWSYESPRMYAYCAPRSAPREVREFRYALLRPHTNDRTGWGPWETNSAGIHICVPFDTIRPDKGGKLTCELSFRVLVWDESIKRMVNKKLSVKVVIPLEGKVEEPPAPSFGGSLRNSPKTSGDNVPEPSASNK